MQNAAGPALLCALITLPGCPSGENGMNGMNGPDAKGADDPMCRPSLQGTFQARFPQPNPLDTDPTPEKTVDAVFENGVLRSIDGIACSKNTDAITARCSSCAQFYFCDSCGVRLTIDDRALDLPAYWKLGSESAPCPFFEFNGSDAGYFVDWEDDRPGCFEGRREPPPPEPEQTPRCGASCQSGGVCCGGAFCGGQCIGNPCCG